MNNQKGFIGIIVVIIIVLVIGGGFYIYSQKENLRSNNNQIEQVNNTEAETEALNFKTFTDSTLGLSFKYPATWPTPTAKSLGSSYTIKVASSTGDLLNVESRSTYNNELGKNETFNEFVSHRNTYKEEGSSYCSRKITLNGKEAVELVGVMNKDDYKNCSGNADLVLVNITPGAVLTIVNNDEGVIDNKVFSSIVSSFTFKK